MKTTIFRIDANAMAFLIAPLAFLCILFTQLRLGNYPVVSPEAALAGSALLLLGAGLGLIVVICPQYLKNGIYALLTAMTANGLFRPFSALAWTGLDDRSYSVAIFVVSLGFFFLIGNKTSELLFVTFLALMLSSALVTPRPSAWQSAVYGTDRQSRAELPPYIHIVLDAHIGLEGVPEAYDPSGRFRSELKDWYIDLGFRVFGNVTVATPPKTVISFQNFLGFVDERSPDYFKRVHDKERNTLGSENLLFTALYRAGYSINVIQSTHLDLCRGPNTDYVVVSCRTYPFSPFMDTLLGSSLGATDKAKVMVNIVFRRSGVGKVVDMIAESSIGLRMRLPKWPIYVCQYCISAMTALMQFDSLVPRIARGEAYFIHLTAPHDPYQFYDENCAFVFPFTYESGSIADSFSRYLGQARCIQVKLRTTLKKLVENRSLRDAVVVIHSDHGPAPYSLNTKSVPFDPESTLPGQAAYSVFFAARAPGLEPEYDRQAHSLPILLKTVFTPLVPHGNGP